MGGRGTTGRCGRGTRARCPLPLRVRDGLAHVAGALEAPRGILLEAPREDSVEAQGQIRASAPDRIGHVAQDGRPDVGVGLPREGSPAGGEFVDQDAEREQIGARVGGFAAQLLGRHVRNRSEHLSRGRER